MACRSPDHRHVIRYRRGRTATQRDRGESECHFVCFAHAARRPIQRQADASAKDHTIVVSAPPDGLFVAV